jgi:four helix bundle protein
MNLTNFINLIKVISDGCETKLFLQIHQLTSNDISEFEMFETGSQIRRSIKSVKANIAEGYRRRQYKYFFIQLPIKQFIKFYGNVDGEH